ncbi:MFS transporter, partial [Vibrio alfacsensis]
MPILHFNKPEQSDQDTVLRRLFIALACLLFIFGTISNWTVPALIDLTKTLYGVSPQAVHYPISQWLLIPVFIAGIVSHIYLRRTYTPM